MEPLPNLFSFLGTLAGWVTALATIALAFFAGWQLKGKSIRYSAAVQNTWKGDTLFQVRVSISNPSNKDLRVEAISIRHPWCLVVDDKGDIYGRPVNTTKMANAKRTQHASYELHVPPSDDRSFQFVVGINGDIGNTKRIPFALSILKGDSVRPKSERLGALLPQRLRT